jgi:hypothetical protein
LCFAFLAASAAKRGGRPWSRIHNVIRSYRIRRQPA